MSSLLKFILVCFIPVFSLNYLKKNKSVLDQDFYKIRYGTLYSNIRINQPGALNTNFVFCLRRFMLTFATVYFRQWLILQIMVYTYTTLFKVCFYISVRPMDQPYLNHIEIINEVFTLSSLYFIIYFTDWCANPELKSYVGELYMYFVIGIVALNFLLIVKEMTSQLLRKKYLTVKGMIWRKNAEWSKKAKDRRDEARRVKKEHEK